MDPPSQANTGSHLSQLQHQLQLQHNHYSSASQLSAPVRRVRFFELAHIISASDPSLRVESVIQSPRPILKNGLKSETESFLSSSSQSIAIDSEPMDESEPKQNSPTTELQPIVETLEEPGNTKADSVSVSMADSKVEQSIVSEEKNTMIVEKKSPSPPKTDLSNASSGSDPKSPPKIMQHAVNRTLNRRYSSLSVILPGNIGASPGSAKGGNFSPRRKDSSSHRDVYPPQKMVSYATAVQPPTPVAISQVPSEYLSLNVGRVRSVSSTVRTVDTQAPSARDVGGKGYLVPQEMRTVVPPPESLAVIDTCDISEKLDEFRESDKLKYVPERRSQVSSTLSSPTKESFTNSPGSDDSDTEIPEETQRLIMENAKKIPKWIPETLKPYPYFLRNSSLHFEKMFKTYKSDVKISCPIIPTLRQEWELSIGGRESSLSAHFDFSSVDHHEMAHYPPSPPHEDSHEGKRKPRKPKTRQPPDEVTQDVGEDKESSRSRKHSTASTTARRRSYPLIGALGHDQAHYTSGEESPTSPNLLFNGDNGVIRLVEESSDADESDQGESKVPPHNHGRGTSGRTSISKPPSSSLSRPSTANSHHSSGRKQSHQQHTSLDKHASNVPALALNKISRSVHHGSVLRATPPTPNRPNSARPLTATPKTPVNLARPKSARPPSGRSSSSASRAASKPHPPQSNNYVQSPTTQNTEHSPCPNKLIEIQQQQLHALEKELDDLKRAHQQVLSSRSSPYRRQLHFAKPPKQHTNANSHTSVVNHTSGTQGGKPNIEECNLSTHAPLSSDVTQHAKFSTYVEKQPTAKRPQSAVRFKVAHGENTLESK